MTCLLSAAMRTISSWNMIKGFPNALQWVSKILLQRRRILGIYSFLKADDEFGEGKGGNLNLTGVVRLFRYCTAMLQVTKYEQEVTVTEIWEKPFGKNDKEKLLEIFFEDPISTARKRKLYDHIEKHFSIEFYNIGWEKIMLISHGLPISHSDSNGSSYRADELEPAKGKHEKRENQYRNRHRERVLLCCLINIVHCHRSIPSR